MWESASLDMFNESHLIWKFWKKFYKKKEVLFMKKLELIQFEVIKCIKVISRTFSLSSG